MGKTMSKNLLTERHKVEVLLSKIPRDEFLSVITTQEQIEQFLRLRYHYFLVSKCWKSYHNGRKQPPELNELPRRVADYILDITHWFNDIWGLVFDTFSDVKEYAEKCRIDFPFNEPYELFIQIVILHADNQLEPYLMKYKQVSHKKTQKVLKLCREASERDLGEKEIKEIDVWLGGLPKNVWLGLAMNVWRESKRSCVQDDLERFKKRTSRIAEYVRLETRKNKSYVLTDGVKVFSSGVNGREGYKVS